jgi:hypothetical protein
VLAGAIPAIPPYLVAVSPMASSTSSSMSSVSS